jgi:hypothetical protein
MKLIKIIVGLLLIVIGGVLIGQYLTIEGQVPVHKYLMAFLMLAFGGGLLGSAWFGAKPIKTTMSPDEAQTAKDVTLPFNRWAYALFIILGIYQYVNYGLSDALPSFGIALAFDPFNPQQKWNDRPLWQKIWLTTHALAVLTALVFILLGLF